MDPVSFQKFPKPSRATRKPKELQKSESTDVQPARTFGGVAMDELRDELLPPPTPLSQRQEQTGSSELRILQLM